MNFLAPADDDRFFETPTGPHNLRFVGALPGPLLRMEDGWQRIRLTLHAPGAAEYWVAPIETVSESEGGFERVYQGSQILRVWRPELVHANQLSLHGCFAVWKPSREIVKQKKFNFEILIGAMKCCLRL